MAKALQGRHLAEIEGEFVVFLIGARFELLRARSGRSGISVDAAGWVT